jgi:hypothetical protein
VRQQRDERAVPVLVAHDDRRRQCAQQAAADLAVELVGARQQHGGAIGVVAPGPHADVHRRLDLAAIGRRAALPGEDHGLRRGRRVVGDRVRLGPAHDGDVAVTEPQRLVAVEPDEGFAADDGDQGQRRRVLDPQRPRRVETRAQGRRHVRVVRRASPQQHPRR